MFFSIPVFRKPLVSAFPVVRKPAGRDAVSEAPEGVLKRFLNRFRGALMIDGLRLKVAYAGRMEILSSPNEDTVRDS
jgi:hypothetical protein